MRLYLFPALIPLAELVPWLLTALGAVAGLAGFSFKPLWMPHGRKILVFALVCLVAAAGAVVAYRPAPELRYEGTTLVEPGLLPAAVVATSDFSPVGESRAAKFGELRRWRVAQQNLATPVMAAGRLVLGAYDGKITAHHPDTGVLLWTVALKEPVLALTADENNIIYAGEGLHTAQVSGLTAVRAEDGKVLWRREFLGHVEEPPAVHPELGAVFTGSGPASLWALDIADGNIKWHGDIGHMDSRPLVHDDVVYAQARRDEEGVGGFFYALDADRGGVLWQVALPGSPWGQPELYRDGQTVLTTSGDGQIGLNKDTDKGWAHAISLKDKKILWTRELPDMPLQPGLYVPEDDLVIETLKDGAIVALNAQTGDMVWQAKVGSDIQSVATLITHAGRPLIAVASFDGFFAILRASDGEEYARRAVPKGTTSSPVAAGDKIYVATPYEVTVFGGLYALAETP